MSTFRAAASKTALVLLLAALALAACAGKQTPANANDGKVLIVCPVKDAEVWIGGRFLGQVRSLGGGILLEPGTHLIEVRHDHYHTDYSEVEVAARERVVVRVYLAEKLL